MQGLVPRDIAPLRPTPGGSGVIRQRFFARLTAPVRRANDIDIFGSWSCSPVSHQKRSQTLKSKKQSPRLLQRNHEKRCFHSSTLHKQWMCETNAI
ncbi:hypothetical protein HBI70_232710 [Parastagonospora nodorum]|nr:hypothetical protein HBH54_240770 [Parastagonospora nodorum]KAH3939991.1 hypothetical protein HBH53_225400 [Parastagonospora nodorum]KAH3956992.1 hypothetical protein HBH51_232030 [Parastagonospora nodorum]KAH4125470.1 hypothetical protein HBH45_231880 [Parastagonospora nodorum]KAH4319868.1 hypothetical protein HBI00_235990 [Parastagonospora nodorum]